MTRKLHDRLDEAMSGDFTDLDSYTRFLRTQLAARLPVERWLASNIALQEAPPEQTPLLRDDLTALGASTQVPMLTFSPPVAADPLGAVWVLAGSHLGNRSMLAALPEGHRLPTAFLADEQMTRFWRKLRPALEAERTGEHLERTLLAANAVFALFLDAADTAGSSEKAAA